MKEKDIKDIQDEKWTQFHNQQFKAYISNNGDIIYLGEFDGKYEVIYMPNSGMRYKLYNGKNEKVANNWLSKIIGGKDR